MTESNFLTIYSLIAATYIFGLPWVAFYFFQDNITSDTRLVYAFLTFIGVSYLVFPIVYGIQDVLAHPYIFFFSLAFVLFAPFIIAMKQTTDSFTGWN